MSKKKSMGIGFIIQNSRFVDSVRIIDKIDLLEVSLIEKPVNENCVVIKGE